MPKISVYIPDDLKNRMDKSPTTNWSSIAQRAYEKECNMNEIKMPEDALINAAIIRLRQSREAFYSANELAGYDAGRDWAIKEASYGRLTLVADENDFLDIEGLAELICDKFEDKGFWSDISKKYNDQYPNDDYAFSFIKGASSIWQSIADKI